LATARDGVDGCGDGLFFCSKHVFRYENMKFRNLFFIFLDTKPIISIYYAFEKPNISSQIYKIYKKAHEKHSKQECVKNRFFEENFLVICIMVHRNHPGHSGGVGLHSYSKFRVFTTEAFRSEKSIETFDYLTEVSGKTNEIFNIPEVSFLVKFINLIRNFVISLGIFQALANK
jgi:hypothetical protein